MQDACFPCEASLMTWALTLALTMALSRKLALCATATPPMRRLADSHDADPQTSIQGARS